MKSMCSYDHPSWGWERKHRACPRSSPRSEASDQPLRTGYRNGLTWSYIRIHLCMQQLCCFNKISVYSYSHVQRKYIYFKVVSTKAPFMLCTCKYECPQLYHNSSFYIFIHFLKKCRKLQYHWLNLQFFSHIYIL